MIIKYLGTGAAEGVPAMFCNCENCKLIRKLGESEYRKRTQVLLDGVLSVDFPPEAYVHSLRFGINFADLKYLLVTHSHMDHFYAHDFILHGYKYADSSISRLEIYGNSEVYKVFCECTAREMRADVAEHVAFNIVEPFKQFSVGEYRVITIPANHKTAEDALLYYIERGGKGYLHLFDTGLISEAALDFLAQKGAKANLVSFDCTFGAGSGGPQSRHMGINEAMQVKDGLLKRNIIDEDTKCVITHFSHNSKPTRSDLRALEDKFNVIAAYDGLEIEI